MPLFQWVRPWHEEQIPNQDDQIGIDSHDSSSLIAGVKLANSIETGITKRQRTVQVRAIVELGKEWKKGSCKSMQA